MLLNHWLAILVVLQSLVLLVILARWLINRYEIEIDPAVVRYILIGLAAGSLVTFGLMSALKPHTGGDAATKPPIAVSHGAQGHAKPSPPKLDPPGKASPHAAKPAPPAPSAAPAQETPASSPPVKEPPHKTQPAPSPGATQNKAAAAPEASPSAARETPAAAPEKSPAAAEPASPPGGNAHQSAGHGATGHGAPAKAKPVKEAPVIDAAPGDQVRKILETPQGMAVSKVWNGMTLCAEDAYGKDAPLLKKIQDRPSERARMISLVERYRKQYLRLRPRLKAALGEFKTLIYRGLITVGAYQALEAVALERFDYLLYSKFTFPRTTDFSDLRLEMNSSLLKMEKQYLGIIELLRQNLLTSEVLNAEKQFFCNDIDFILRARSLAVQIEGSGGSGWSKRLKVAKDNEKTIDSLVAAHRSSAELLEKKAGAGFGDSLNNPDIVNCFEIIVELCRLNAVATKPKGSATPRTPVPGAPAH